MRKPVVAVIGASQASDEEREFARELGKALAEQGWVVVTGGLSGVMEAASRGASDAGGLVVGLVPGPDPESANAWVGVSIATGMGDARNALITNTAGAFVAIGGGWGTLSEIAFALKRGKPVVAHGTWNLDPARSAGACLVRVASVADAMAQLSQVIECGSGDT